MLDILLDDTNDLVFEGGDFAIDESTLQHQKLLLQSMKGDWREDPGAGIGVFEFLKDENERSILPEAKEQFERDGMTVRKLALSNGIIEVDAYYP